MKRHILILIASLFVLQSFGQGKNKSSVPMAQVDGLIIALKAKVSLTDADARYFLKSEALPGYTASQIDSLLEFKADTAGQTYTGSHQFPTQNIGTVNTTVANTAFVATSAPMIQFQDGAMKTNTGNITENLVGTYTVRSGNMGANGSLDIEFYAHIATAAQASTIRVYINAVLVGTLTLSANTYSPNVVRIWNQNSVSSQKIPILLTWAANTSGAAEFTFNTNANMTVTFTVQASNSAYTAYLDRVRAITYFSN